MYEESVAEPRETEHLKYSFLIVTLLLRGFYFFIHLFLYCCFVYSL